MPWFLLALLLAAGASPQEPPAPAPARDHRLRLPPGAPAGPAEIDAAKLTHVNYAFANVRQGRVVEGFAHDAENLRVLTGLRAEHPQLRILVSVGGWTWSKGFSDVALTPRGAARFCESALDYVRRHDLDGIDVDWEYPGLPGDGNTHRPEDKSNFTALMAELRAQLDRESGRTGRRYRLTFAAGALPRLPRPHGDGEGPGARGLRQPDDLRLPGGGRGRRWPATTRTSTRTRPTRSTPRPTGPCDDFLAAGVPPRQARRGCPVPPYDELRAPPR